MEDKKLTICFFGNAASIHTAKWVKYFADEGNKVHLISYTSFRDLEVKNVNLHLLKKRFPIKIWPFNTLLNLPFTLIQVKKLMSEINPDIIHAHYVTSYGHLAALTKVHPLVITAWGSDILITPKKYLMAKLIVKYVLKKADLITCDADHMKKAMMELGTDKEKIRIIYFGVDTQKFSPYFLLENEGVVSSCLEEKNLEKELQVTNSKRVISLRDLEPVYNVETLIRAIPSVLKEVPETKFIIVSKGSQRKELKELTEELKIKDSIRFIGLIPSDNVINYLRIADVCVSTSLSDGGIASSTAEAMASGLPVVITDTGENRKWIKDGESGFIIPIKSPKILAQKIIYLLKNKKQRLEMGQEGRKIIKQKNDYYNEMEKMENLYKDIIKNYE